MLLFRKYAPTAGWLSFLFFLLAVLKPVTAVYAQASILNPQKPAVETPATQWPIDSLGRRTPRGTVEGFIKAVGQENYTLAGEYLNLNGPAPTHRKQSGAALAQTLQRLLDQQGNIIPNGLISNDTTGLTTDDFGPNLDLVGTIKANGETIDVLVEKTKGPNGGPIWLFSSETVQRLPALNGQTNGFTINQWLPRLLKQNKWNGVPIGHWLAMVVLMVLAYLLCWGLTAIGFRLLRLVWAKAREEHPQEVIRAFLIPIRISLAVLLFITVSQQIGISIIVRQRFSEVTAVVGLIALLLLLWQLVDVFSQLTKRRLIHSGQSGGISVVLFLRRGIKLLLIAFGVIAVLNVFGWNVTSGLAALGIGGIALALGAQKTIENFVGSLTIITDQPIRVGDFCKVDGMAGTVEQIGIRSTRIRTPNRTLVVIPNGKLAALTIENFAFRDRILFNPVLGLRYETTPEQIRYLLAEIRSIFANNPSVNPDPARVRFVGWRESSVDIELYAYIDVRDYNQYLEIQETLTLQIMDAVAASGTSFAFPSQTLYMNRDRTTAENKPQPEKTSVRPKQKNEQTKP